MKDDTEDSGTPTSDDAAGTIEEGTESVRRTIVGGRPLDRRRRKVRIPIGIEKVLCAAAADREFREQLLMARADALLGTGLDVSPSEAMILGSVSEGALRTMIENIDLKRHKRRRFFRGIAAASLAATTAVVGVGCLEAGGASAEDRSDMPTWADVGGGTRSDTIDVDDKFADGGMQYHDIEFEEKLTDLGATDGPPEIVDVDQVSFDVGDTADEPDEIDPLDVPEVTAGVDVKDPSDTMDMPDEVDVDIQPMPAGIPPMEDVKEPE